jgi:glycolate oxidase
VTPPPTTADAAGLGAHVAALASVTADRDVRAGFARDVSGLEAVPDAVARPRDADELAALLRAAHADRIPVTVAGGQSSTTAASITERGVLCSLLALDRVDAPDPAARTIRVGAGARIADVRRAAAAAGLLFAPDPTSEREATVGGAIACNASGARSLAYGATGDHVRAVTVLLADGTRHELRRPALEKNTVGFPVAHDPVSWFVGSEGTLGVVVEAELALLPLPARTIGLAVPFASEADALAFVVAARGDAAVSPRCLEYFDAPATALVRAADGDRAWREPGTTLVYVEDAGDEEAPLDAWLALAEAHGAQAADIRAFTSEPELEHARVLRHAVPATMNERGARARPAGGRKVSTDWAVPHAALASVLAEARRLADEAGVPQAVTYGHAGNGHPHQNFIARDADELARIEAVVGATLDVVVRRGGTVAAEHGIGKLKRKWLPLQCTPLQLGVMRALKRQLDPHGLLAPGNVLAAAS